MEWWFKMVWPGVPRAAYLMFAMVLTAAVAAIFVEG
jgi:hypothetical protein